jgi:DNA-binding Lrp family transcriptional regulator
MFIRKHLFGSNMKKAKIDETDVKILHELVKDARKKLKDIANDIGLSNVATLRRVKRLKANGIITGATIFKDASLLGHLYPALIGVNLEGNSKTLVEELSREQTNLAGLSPSVGKFDLCVFVVAKSINELDDLKRRIRKKEGVKKVSVNIWTKSRFNFEFELKPAGE